MGGTGPENGEEDEEDGRIRGTFDLGKEKPRGSEFPFVSHVPYNPPDPPIFLNKEKN